MFLRATRRFLLFFFNDTAPTEIYTLSLHDALPILRRPLRGCRPAAVHQPGSRDVSQRGIQGDRFQGRVQEQFQDRKSTRLNSSHTVISYAVFCLKKKKTKNMSTIIVQSKTHYKYSD